MDLLELHFLQLKKKSRNHEPRYWDGKAGKRIIKILVRQLVKDSAKSAAPEIVGTLYLKDVVGFDGEPGRLSKLGSSVLL